MTESDNTKKQVNTLKTYIPALIFYPLAIVFWELSLKFMDSYNSPWNITLAVTFLFAVAAGLLLAFIFTALRPIVISRILSGIVLIAIWIFFCFEHDCIQFYKMYYSIAYAIGATGQVMGDFSDVVWEVALEYALQEAYFLIPVIIYFIFMCRIIPKGKYPKKLIPIVLIPFLVLQITASAWGRFSDSGNLYTHDFTFHASVPRIGLLNSLRLEITYIITGTPMADIEDDSFELWTPETDNAGEGSESDNSQVSETVQNNDSYEDSNVNEINEENNSDNDNVSDNSDWIDGGAEDGSIEYDYNADVDFAELIENEDNTSIKKMHEYFGSLEPSMQNDYTGFFEGKNLIFMTVEAFSPYAIDKDFTPTLYKLANEGFVFENYYQPYWSLSTTGGEFATMTGVIPEWIEAGNSFTVSENRYMPYSIGNLLRNEGYSCKAFHNSTFDYYERDKTHPNLGYDYKGIGNGLKMDLRYWPASDCEMMEVTLPDIIAESKETGEPFHAYYMTVSGHCNYNWGGNAMSKRNKDAAVEAFPDSSTTIQAYMACNKEFDKACEYILEELEKEGILEDTVICFTADHYPYAMAEGNVDYYVELSGIEDTPKSISRYKNTLVIYCASMEEPVIVDTPCSSIDIIPTLDNLFGVEYDSRLYSGRDILATNYEADKVSTSMPLVILPIGNKYSFITAAGSYDCTTKEFTPNPGIEVDENYVKDVLEIISNKWTYAKLIITNDYYSKVFGQNKTQPDD